MEYWFEKQTGDRQQIFQRKSHESEAKNASLETIYTDMYFFIHNGGTFNLRLVNSESIDVE